MKRERHTVRRAGDQTGNVVFGDIPSGECAVPRTALASRAPLAPDPALHWFLAGGKLGLPNWSLWLRTLLGAAIWMAIPLYVIRWLGRTGRRGAMHLVQRWWARGLARWLELAIELEGVALIDPQESYIVVPLHEGFADVLALQHLPLALRFVVRDELLTWQRLGPYLRDTGHIGICPEAGVTSYRKLLCEARGVVASGESLVIFPQGSILGIELGFARGAFAVARALGRPILPIALTGSHRIWEYPYTPRLRYGQRVSLRVFPPMSAAVWETRSLDEVRRDVQCQVKAAALSGTMAPPRHFVPSRDGYWDGYNFRVDPAYVALATEVKNHRRAAADRSIGATALAPDAGAA